MPDVSIVTDSLHVIGESLIRVNNLAAHIGIEIRAIQHDLLKAIHDMARLKADEQKEIEPSIPDEFFTVSEVQELHALETTRTCLMSSWRGVEAKRRIIFDRARGRMSDQAGEIRQA